MAQFRTEYARQFIVIASVLGFTGVGLGAFGAHALKSIVSSDMLSVFETAVRYQMYHAFALAVVAWALDGGQNRTIRIAGWLFVAGVILFSGSLYLLVLTASRGFGFITPFGGVSLLGGWLLLALGFWKNTSG
ncbi:MAG TPA: DUF423 domain-containing protein [Bacteroidota bacterium]